MSLKKADWEKIGNFFGFLNPEKATIKDIQAEIPQTRTEAKAYLYGLIEDDPCMAYLDTDLLDEIYPLGPEDLPDPWIIPAKEVTVEVITDSAAPEGIDPNVVLGQLIIIDQIKIDKVPITLVIHEWEPNTVYAKSGLLDPGFGAPCTWGQWSKAKKEFNLQLALRMFGDKNVLPDFQVHENATYREAAVLQKLKGRITAIISKEISTLGYYSNCFSSEIWESIDLFRLKALSPDTDITALSAKVDGVKMRHTAQALGGTALLQQTTSLQKAIKANLALR